MKFIGDDDDDEDVKPRDLRDDISPGVVGVSTRCNFAGAPVSFRIDGPWLMAPGVDVHAAGQGTHQ